MIFVAYRRIPILEAARMAGIQINEQSILRTEVEAYCPFCNGSRNHLYLNTERDQWYCQKCRTGGNSVTLYAKVRGINNAQAYQELISGTNIVSYCPRANPEPSYLAPLEIRHAVYYDLIAMLELSREHRDSFRARGLSDERIAANGYRTLPNSPSVILQICRRLEDIYDLRGVPGFYRSNGEVHWKMHYCPGILVPYCDVNGYIQGMQIRKDHIGKSGKYCWFSTNPEYKDAEGRQIYPNGTKTKSWIHVTGNISSSTAYITEGAIKGDVASYFFHDALFFCTAGAGSVSQLKQVISQLGPKRIYGCYDMDQLVNGPSEALRRMEDVVKETGIPYQNKKWDPTFNGIDNYAQHLFNAA